ncbi:MAG TPA: glycosyltransferase [Solirubrobacteraceae bacterium]|jgi:GT2 family glycosyltransferase
MLPPAASIIIPTRERPGYLEVALASVAPQARRAGAELILVDDGALEQNAQLAERFGARYVSLGEPRGLNAARNAGAAAASGELLAFIDDDVEVHPDWLDALLAAAASDPAAGVFTGPIIARFEGRPRHVCGREGAPITSMDLGGSDRDVTRAWGANLTIRRRALDAVGPFDAHRHVWSGDEEEWEERFLAAGGRIRYVAAAGLVHRRDPADARMRALMAVAFARGLQARDYDEEQGRAPSLVRELRVLAGCVWHTLRRRCANGPVMAAHSWGRIARARQGRHDHVRGDAAADFLSGESGTLGGRRDKLRALADRALDLRSLPQLARTRRAARTLRRRVLVASVVREHHRALYEAALAELRRSGCEIVALECPPGELGKFANLNRLLAGVELENFDWLLVLDDDIELPKDFLRPFLYLSERFALRLAAPAHRLLSHAAWRLTRRQGGSLARETAFVEIGPLTALARETFATLLPFPEVGMGWGLDAHWAWLAREHGWPIGLIDLLPIAHTAAPAASAYGREEAVAAARVFLATHPYLSVRESQRTLAVHRRCA